MTEFAAPPGARPGLGRKAARGAFVTFGGQGIKIAIQTLSVMLLARLLTPRDYGLIAMVVAIIGVGDIFRDFGLSSAAIQSKTLSKQQRDNLFWINAAIGLTLATIVYLGSGLIAHIYGQPRLIPIAQVLCLTFVCNGLATQFRADLNRRLLFLRLTIADIAAPTVGLVVALVMAAQGATYWALVGKQLAQTFALFVMLAAGAHWIPGLPRRHANMGRLLRFGSNLVVTQVIGYGGNNVDALNIGIRLGAGPLGYYNRAFSLLMTPLTQLRAPTTMVALPILARLSDDDDRYSQFVQRGQLALGYTLVAGLAVVVGAAEPFTRIFLGSTWISVAPILRLLALAGVFQTLAYVGYWIYLSRGLTRDLMRYSIISALINVVCITAGCTWGVVGVAAGYALSPALSWPLSLWWLSRRTPIPMGILMRGALRILAVASCAAAASAVVVQALAHTGAFVQLLAALGTAAAVYALAALTRPVRADLVGVVGIVRLATGRTNR